MDSARQPGSDQEQRAKPEVAAAFDIGSNSVKMSIARLLHDSSFQEFLWRAETTRIGSDIDRTGVLAADRIDDTIDALQIMALEARRKGATRLVAVATEAVRVARNGNEFLARMLDDTGIEVWQISGEEEAALTFHGLGTETVGDRTAVVADIGGGSTEFIEAIGGEIEQVHSLPVGSGRLTDRFIDHDPPETAELESVRAEARARFENLRLPSPADRLVLTGGTAEYLQRMLPHEWPAVSTEIEDVLGQLVSIESAELAARVGCSQARALVLPAGVAIAVAVCDLTDPVTIVGAPSGIRTGLLEAVFSGRA